MDDFTQKNSANQTAITALLNLVQAVYTLNQTMSVVFPQTLGTSGSATGGAATLPANPVGFISALNPATGATIKIPYYS